MVKCTNVIDYWNQTKLSYISDVFPRGRFLYLLKYFHFVNNFDSIPETEKLHKLRPLIMGYKKFSRCVLPGTNISVDESMVAIKGRNIMKVFIKSKHHKYNEGFYKSKHHSESFRKFEASCPRTGYCYSRLFDDKRPWLQSCPRTGYCYHVYLTIKDHDSITSKILSILPLLSFVVF